MGRGPFKFRATLITVEFGSFGGGGVLAGSACRVKDAKIGYKSGMTRLIVTKFGVLRGHAAMPITGLGIKTYPPYFSFIQNRN